MTSPQPAEWGGQRESASGISRRQLQLGDHEHWLAQFRAGAEALKDEDLNSEPEAW